MDIQLKRGLLETCVLAAIADCDSYGYKIIKDLSGVVEISESTLYPILKRLESGGYLRVFTEEHNSRLRKYYAITKQGLERIPAFLAEWEEVARVVNYIKTNSEGGDKNG
ncbi:MAG: PadR family transcriptional regulator [Oscillospiraceae bacterium]|jgi:PadR family transcriptional regulator PadR|nr:PadR family transcriptional regulator [Oscillospiraceae bacterium]